MPDIVSRLSDPAAGIDEDKFKERNRGQQRMQALKKTYDKQHESALLKQFAKSSFLTPEAAMYLNEQMKAKQSKVDKEIVYAGLHSENVSKIKFKRTEKNKQRFKNRVKRSQKKTNRHA